MAIFDKELNHLDPQDTAGSLKTLENYISYMRERLEFNNSNLTRTLSSTGTSAAEIVLILAALQNNVQAMQSSVNAMQGKISTLENSVTTMQTTIQNIDQRVTALEAKGGTT